MTARVPAARTALVTGGTRGIGRAVAAGLVAAGLDVALLGRDAVTARDAAAALAASATTVPDGARTVLGLGADVTDRAAVDRAVAAATARLGSVDLLVNAAGLVDAEVPLWEADPDEWWDVLETNVRGPFHLAHAVVPGMLARGGGRVVDLASGASTHEMDGASAYNASKTALARLGANLHVTGFDRGLRTFEVAPGVVRTDMTASMRMHADRTEWTPVERTVEMVLAIARGDLDAWSGCFVRVTTDSPASLRAAQERGAPGPVGRRLRPVPWGDDDPLR
ncbi:NADP-dependent 3-hydroxy acid dehydrogenase YdfG [Sediminihabitans luteus]|uniref:NADP-dependent 3-hydroxy acid dehydrogenase YdfG n=1 Tax=Sediminihabitans luteus TaxID=1138585 RepID=A0A2M9CCL2_9CELL|nr:SDR family NAD(P)-dependent oxidoreductase [Sediminihabitans luteus]PJJ69122.1 NADP-dependent 3-hydroxy acid dehydrogenase YdfG [Sediminihabitans luteus]GII99508.1 hypothetical protein Slu03_18860 [Sediminihabitans luteus]